MNILTKIISATYPFRMLVARLTGIGIRKHENYHRVIAPVNFFSLQATLNTGEIISMEKYRGKQILVVNLASQCGYTPQYKALETMYRQHDQLMVLGFPSNDFGGQEPGSDKEIAKFCQVNFGVSFPVFKKDKVSGVDKQSVYTWLCDKEQNGWNREAPQWNFYKYLVDEQGNLSKVFSSAVSPGDIAL